VSAVLIVDTDAGVGLLIALLISLLMGRERFHLFTGGFLFHPTVS
jgi:hypothetical protein